METLTKISQKPQPEETSHAAIIHISALSSLVGIPFGSILGPLITWIIWRDQNSFTDENGKEALNFNISIFLYQIVIMITGLVLFLSPVLSMATEDDPATMLWSLPGLWILISGIGLLFLIWIILIIVATVKAGKGKTFHYPLTIRFIK